MPTTASPSAFPPGDIFQRGLEALERKQYQQAIKMFQSAMDQDKLTSSTKGPRMQYLSYLGLAITLSQGRSEEGYKLCLQATQRDFFDADLFCNLGIVCLRNRRKGEAFEAFRKGLILKPRHARIHEELNRHERRERLVFPGLSRSHFLNRFGGRLRYKLRQLFSRAPGLSE